MRKAVVNSPARVSTDPFYSSDCRLALEPSIQGLMDMAIKAGWIPNEVSYTIMMLGGQKLELCSTDEQHDWTPTNVTRHHKWSLQANRPSALLSPAGCSRL